MNVFGHIQRWLRGVGHSRGFGIQSPWAYRLVTEVLCQQLPYHAYDDLLTMFPNVGRRRLRLCRLYLRLANYRQTLPWTIVLESDAPRGMVEEYVRAGCRNACVVLTTEWPQGVGDIPETGMLVVEGISGGRREPWQQLLSDPHVGVSFDLFDCGICFFDHALNKRSYVINL